MMQIRRATVEDAELLCHLVGAVQQIHYEARRDFFKPYTITPELIADFQNRLSDEQVYVFIGEVDGEPVGYILAQLFERADNPYTYASRQLLVDQMSVNPEQRSKGYGEALMERVFDLAKSLGCKSVILTVWAFNERAVEFYRRQGFVARDMRMEVSLDERV